MVLLWESRHKDKIFWVIDGPLMRIQAQRKNMFEYEVVLLWEYRHKDNICLNKRWSYFESSSTKRKFVLKIDNPVMRLQAQRENMFD